MKSASMRLYGMVGDPMEGFTAEGVGKQLDGFRAQGVNALEVYINSPGGNAMEGLAIHSQMQRYPGTVTMHVDGAAGSIASIIALAGKRLVMPAAARLMIHRPWLPLGMVGGDSRDLAALEARLPKIRADLDGLNDTLRDIYVAKSGLSPERVQQMMDETTYLTGTEAKALGFCDEVVGTRPEKRPTMGARAELVLNQLPKLPADLRTMDAVVALRKLEAEVMRQRIAGYARGASAAGLTPSASAPGAKSDRSAPAPKEKSHGR